jgi:hypothetical protein
VTRRARLTALVAGATVAALVGATPAWAAPGPSDAPEYWFDQWHVTSLWAQGARGGGVTIAEIDTGVNAALPELHSNVLPGIDLGVPGNGQTDRQTGAFGHGTAMASIMVGQAGILGITGLAPDAKLLPIAVPLTGTTDAGKPDRIAAAIRWAADHGGKVISMSLGGASSAQANGDPCPADEQQAVYYAITKGSVVLAASGNDGPTRNTVEEPGVCLGVVSVGAVDASGTVASFSSRHPYLTVSAPGVAIASLSKVLGSAYKGDGTSQATAIASAVVALVWSKYPQLTGRQVVARLLATTDRHSAVRDAAYGYGTIDAYQAVTASVPADAPNPVFAAADPFIARYNSFSGGATRPSQPAGQQRSSFGNVSLQRNARLQTPTVRLGFKLAGAGLLAVLALLAVVLVGRRRRGRAAAVAARHGRVPDAFWRDIVTPSRTGALAPPVIAPPVMPVPPNVTQPPGG